MFQISANNNFLPAQRGVNFITPQAPQPNKVPLDNAVLTKFAPTTWNWGNTHIRPLTSRRSVFKAQTHSAPFDPASPFILGPVGNIPVTPSPFA